MIEDKLALGLTGTDKGVGAEQCSAGRLSGGGHCYVGCREGYVACFRQSVEEGCVGLDGAAQFLKKDGGAFNG